MGQVLRSVIAAVLLAVGVGLIFVFTDLLQKGVDGMIDRVGAVWTLGVVCGATGGLGWLWFRYGGSGVLRRWGGVLIKPRRASDEGAAAPDADADAGPGRRRRLVRPKK